MAYPSQAMPPFSVHDSLSLVALCRDSTAVRIPASLVAVITFLALILSPAAKAAHEAADQTETAQHNTAAVPLDPFADLMQRLERQVAAVLSRVEADGLDDDQAALEALHAEIADLGAQINAQFEAEQDRLAQQDLPPAIMQRQAEAAQSVRDGVQAMLQTVESICDAESLESARDHANTLQDMLGNNPAQRSHQPFDPEQLPFAPATQPDRGPQTDGDALNDQLDQQAWLDALQPGGEPIHLASLGTASAIAGYAAAAQVGASQLPPSDPAYLSPTEDVQITDEIVALAQSLDNQAVAIFNWVYSNIEYIPGHKSVQGSQRTLETRRGNAFDQASLLIALYRAAGIPARYVYGTVAIDEAAARNWLGNLESAAAASNLLGQGGSPVAALSTGGKINLLRLEHIWVEAWVDFFPSRGAINRSPDAWAAVDPSFKQYAYAPGLDLDQAVAFDAQGFVDELLASAEIDQDAGTVRKLDTDLIEQRFEQYLAELEAHIDNTRPDATVGDVIGRKTIIARDAQTLAAGLPYQVQARGRDYATLPPNLRAYYSYTLYASKRDRLLGSPLFTARQSLPTLAGKRLTLSFEPATDADRRLIESRLPSPDDNGNIDPSQLPDSLPGYLIRLNAQLKLDGQVIEQAGPYALGHELSSTSAITDLAGGQHASHNELVAGEFHALGLHYPSGPQEDLAQIQQRLEATRDQIDSDQLDSLTKDTLIGDLLHAGISSYFGAIDAQTRVLSQAQPVAAYNNPGYGAFNTILAPQYRFGVPFNVGFGGIGVDVDAVISNVVAHDNNPDTRIQTVQLLGTQASALEHRIPELLYTDPQNPGEGFSAVKALTRAAQQGQTIHTIDRNNLNQALSQISASDQIKQDITAGVNAGSIVTIHQSPVTVGGTTGFGYTIIDPKTGAGAYRISSGASGGECGDCGGELLTKIAFIIDVLKEAALAVLDDTVFNLLDIFISIYNGLGELKAACTGLLLYGFYIQFVALLSTAFFLGALFPILYGLIFTIIIGFALDQVVNAQLGFCRASRR